MLGTVKNSDFKWLPLSLLIQTEENYADILVLAVSFEQAKLHKSIISATFAYLFAYELFVVWTTTATKKCIRSERIYIHTFCKP